MIYTYYNELIIDIYDNRCELESGVNADRPMDDVAMN